LQGVYQEEEEKAEEGAFTHGSGEAVIRTSVDEAVGGDRGFRETVAGVDEVEVKRRIGGLPMR
jgi:hypothetical protein